MLKKVSTTLLLLPLLATGQTWEQVSSMPAGKHHPVTFAINGYGYSATGVNAAGLVTDDFYQYDPVFDEWTELPDFPGADRGFAIGQAYNGKGYLGFGFGNDVYFDDIWEYEPTTGSWSQLTTCECEGRAHPAFVVRNDKIFVGLGGGENGDLDDWHVYDIINDSWSQADDLPATGRHHPYMFPAGDHVYAGFGHSGNVIFDDWYEFNIDTETWEPMDDFPGEGRVAGTQFEYAGRGYVLSGDGDNHDFMQTGEFWEYDPSEDSWTALDPHPGISRWAPGSFVINGSVYFMGGENRQLEEIMDDVWSYQLSPATSITTEEQRSEIRLFPNPVNGILNVITSGIGSAVITVRNISGKVVSRNTSSDMRTTLNLSHLASGMYTVRVEDNSGIHRSKIVVQ